MHNHCGIIPTNHFQTQNTTHKAQHIRVYTLKGGLNLVYAPQRTAKSRRWVCGAAGGRIGKDGWVPLLQTAMNILPTGGSYPNYQKIINQTSPIDGWEGRERT